MIFVRAGKAPRQPGALISSPGIRRGGTFALMMAMTLVALWGFSLPAKAGHPRLHVALGKLNAAKNASDLSQKQKELSSALGWVKATAISSDMKAPSIALIQAAISDAENGDADKIDHDIDVAIESVQSCLAAADAEDAAKKEAGTASPPKSGSGEDSDGNDSGTNDDFGTATPPAPSHPAATVTLPEADVAAVVLIKGDNSEGTGFLVKTAEGPEVVTNIHVISDNPHLKITTSMGAQITPLSCKGATDRDLAMIAIKDDHYNYLDLATDVGNTAQPGDEVVTPGNSEGGEVMLNTGGKVLGIGPQRVEIDNPIYHGNSGGPVFHVKSNKVVGVVAMGMPVIMHDTLDKASFESRNSAIASSMRYFALRLDNVPKWETYDWNRFQTETLFLDQFHKRSQCLDSYLNASKTNSSKLYLTDDKLRDAIDSCTQEANGGDVSQRKEAVTELLTSLNSLTDTDMDAIENPNNFYAFDQQRAKDELDYRQALKKELAFIGEDFDRLTSMALLNN